MRIPFLQILILCLFFISAPLFSAELPHTAIAIRVIDGDTIKLDTGEKVRLIGIDTPEKYDSKKLLRDAKSSKRDITTIKALGEKASAFTKKLVKGKKVRLEYDIERKDRYGRFLAYVYVPTSELKNIEGYKDLARLEVFVNAELVKQGYAQIYTFPPNVKYEKLFLKLQKEARGDSRGFWAGETFGTSGRIEFKTKEVKKKEDYYVASKRSNKYHRPGCKWAKKVKDSNLIKFDTKEEAVDSGKKACKVCQP